MKSLNTYLVEKLLINKNFDVNIIDVQGLKEACVKHLQKDAEARGVKNTSLASKKTADTMKSYSYPKLYQSQDDKKLEQIYDKIFKFSNDIYVYDAHDYDWNTRARITVALRSFVKQIDEATLNWTVVEEERTENRNGTPDVYELKYVILDNIAILVDGGQTTRLYTFSFKD